ncbi:MAG: DNA-binding domain-containing protein, partial [Gammaproteobacteria bacterium]
MSPEAQTTESTGTAPSFNATELGFIATELGFTRYVRDPDRAPIPEDVEPRRMNIYAELLYNNIQEQLATGFPVLKRILPEERWHALVRDFMVRHRCSTPLFTEIGQEFLAFLREARANHPSDPVFMAELAHYEWVELALYIDESEVDRSGIDPNGDLILGQPVVSPLAWPLAYHFDVHRIGPDYQPPA